jgi:predicted nucleic acid-binding protein
VNGVFLDSVGILATVNKSDRWHAVAVLAYELLVESRAQPFTTTFILAEVGNAAARNPTRRKVCELFDNLNKTDCIIAPTEQDWHAAWAAYRRGEAGDAGIVDHVSFQVMARLGIRRAFTNDRHFRAAGFEPLF